jgi:hypothetical protein
MVQVDVESQLMFWAFLITILSYLAYLNEMYT